MGDKEAVELFIRGAALLAASLATATHGNDGLTLAVADRFAHYITTGEIRDAVTNPNN